MGIGGRSVGMTPRKTMSAASSTANSVPSMKLEKYASKKASVAVPSVSRGFAMRITGGCSRSALCSTWKSAMRSGS